MDWNPTVLAPHDLTFVADVPFVYHCHHYNLFHDQTIDDIVGDEEGAELRREAAHGAWRTLLLRTTAAQGAETAAERIQLAQELFAAMGHGRIELDVSPKGGRAEGRYLHYGFTWAEKYGARVRRQTGVDAVAAGFVAAATEVAYDLPAGSVRAVESRCVARRDPTCVFDVTTAPGGQLPPPVLREDMQRVLRSDGLQGMHEARIEERVAALRSLLSGVRGDERGLVEAFGIFATAHLVGYYDGTAYEAVHRIERDRPDAMPIAVMLLREAGHVCVFNTFGGVLMSPEWEAVDGPLQADPERIVVGCTAIARALGFGHWTIAEFEPGRRLVLRTAANYESPYYLARYGTSGRHRAYFFEGAALAMMVLAHRVDWSARPTLDQAFYDELFRGMGLGFHCEPTKCLACGDEVDEVVVVAD